MGRAKGEGTYEKRPADGKFRHVREKEGKRVVGPFKDSKTAALDAWNEKVDRLAKEAAKAKPVERDITSVGAEIYWCLFGVYESPDGKPPATKGVWADELSQKTYQDYKEYFRARIAGDPIALLHPEKVTRVDLEAFRGRILRTPSTYKRQRKEPYVATNGRRQIKITWETVQRAPPGARTAEKYLGVVINVLRRSENNCADELKDLKKTPPKKAWLARADRNAFLNRLCDEDLRIAAELMLHGLCIAEVCAVGSEDFDGSRIRIEKQLSQIAGKPQMRKELKRERRYRWVPIKGELAAKLAGKEGRFVPLLPNNLRRDLKKATRGTKFAHLNPHDLRRSGGKWMLDAGAKLSDVAAILGNDPKTLLTWYDTADAEGMERAIQAV